jgi:hypothetical protein
MEPKEFIEEFRITLEENIDYNLILDDLNKNVFPFHDKERYVDSRRYYYWLKQNNIFKFKKLNARLKKLVKNKIHMELGDQEEI